MHHSIIVQTRWIGAAAVVAVAGQAQADMIILRHAGLGSGTLDGVPFELTQFFMTAEADTDDRSTVATGWFIDHMSVEISIDGLGAFDILTPTRTFVDNDASMVGFSRDGDGGSDLFTGPTHADFAAWDMLSSIGPLFGEGTLLQWDLDPMIDTSGGVLVFDDGMAASKFKAEVIPAPAGSVLIGLCGAGLLIRRRR